jgi:DNA-binding LacI/PurR family transcriptional regulator
VVIGRPPKQYESRLSYVDNDNIAAAHRLTRHLLELGHENLLFLNAPSYRTVSKDRETGCKNALSDSQMPMSSVRIMYKTRGPTSIEFGYGKTKQLLKKNRGANAIITDNDQMALGVYQAAKELGYKIPEDLSVVSFSDNSVYSPEFSPSLTRIHLNGERLGEEAAKLLIDQLASDQPLVKRVVVPTEFVNCESTGIPGAH